VHGWEPHVQHTHSAPAAPATQQAR
jgi:hypothetical protein